VTLDGQIALTNARSYTARDAPVSIDVSVQWQFGKGEGVRILSRTDLKTLVPMSEAIALMKTAFRELSAGRAVAPVRSVVDVNANPSAMLMMPGFVPESGALGFKVVTFFAGNPTKDLPIIHAVVCLFDDTTGIPLGLMEGGFVTALRTGAVSGAATDLLARPDSRVLTVIGAGVQGVTQAAAVCAVRPIDRIIAVDVREEALSPFVESVERDWPELAPLVEVSTDANAAVREADVICTATTARAPVFEDRDVRPGTHINAVGAFTLEMQELHPDTVTRAIVVIDSLEPILEEAGDLVRPLREGRFAQSHIERELGKLVSGDIDGRQRDDDVTIFKSVGNAVQDVVVARYAIDQARLQGVGQTVGLSQ
jgi:ornithine cyclodeaminase/alanine dehydrogenase-like protein (mu-crystallin family)